MTDVEIHMLFLSDGDLSGAFEFIGKPLVDLLERLVADGVVPPERAEQVQAEMSRRIHSAVRQLHTADATHRATELAHPALKGQPH